MPSSKKLAVYFWSIWYLKPAMVYWRVHRAVKTTMIRIFERRRMSALLPAASKTLVGVRAFPALTTRYHHEPMDLSGRRFSFLRDAVQLPEDRAKRIEAVRRQPLLWRFHFDYHDYLCALLDDDPPAELDSVLAFVREWSGDNPPHEAGARTSAWHPYVLSIRIESWIRIHARSRAHGGIAEADMQALADGVELMTRVLLRNLEHGTRANHLMRNIKALILAGVFLDHPTAKRALRKGTRLLRRELREQFLLDGMHFERSPMYHVSILNDLLDMHEVLSRTTASGGDALRSVIGRATGFLKQSLHPDGEIPYFNDSTSSFFLDTREVLARARRVCEQDGISIAAAPLTFEAFEAPDRISGLLFHRSDDLFVAFDAGVIGPAYQPGHAHCDTLSYEVSWKNERLICDTGVFHYKESPERSYSRSTVAHNTVRIDAEDQSEVWKSFRVGRRARIRIVSRREEDGCEIFQAAHDGYARIEHDLLHERALVIRPGAWIAVVDFIHGTGAHMVENIIHFVPLCKVARRKDGTVATNRQGDQCGIRPLRGENMRMYDTEYYPAFGVRQLRKTVVFHGTVQLPHLTGYVITLGADVETPQVTVGTADVKIGDILISSKLDFGRG
jgi:uncharacterized heparinase superfamily protein